MAYEKESEIIVFEITGLLFGLYPIIQRKSYSVPEYPSEYVVEYAFTFYSGRVTGAIKTMEKGFDEAMNYVRGCVGQSVV
jgi:thiamine transporter ThiT